MKWLRLNLVISLKALDNQVCYIYSIKKMKRMKKILRIENIQLTTTEEHPKDVSRAHLRVIDIANANQTFKTFHYGIVEPMKINWATSIELPFTAQESLKFETICEHQYGYEIEELKALYNGIIYLKPDQFFFQNATHCFNQQGRQCGTLKYMPKIIERQQDSKKIQQKVQTKEPVKVNLIAKISIYAASLNVNPYFNHIFHKKKRNLKLEIKYDRDTYRGQPKFGELQYKWNLNSKFQVTDRSPELIYIKIFEDDHQYLSGMLQMATLEENKRFTVQIVNLVDQNNEKIANLHIDLRFVSKRQLLDLMYSPKQLSDSKMNDGVEKHFEHKNRASSQAGELKHFKKLVQLQQYKSMSKQLMERRSKISPTNRYKILLINEKNQSSIPRSRRFSSPKNVNEQISYIDPILFSDFSPQRKLRKGPSQSTTNKTDFTKILKANPGVGQYHLPSIWQKK